MGAECCAQNLLNVFYFVRLSLRPISSHIIQTKFLAQHVWRLRGKTYPQIITFKAQNLDPNLWSISVLKKAPVFIQNSGQIRSQNTHQISTKKFFFIAQILLAILVIWVAQISIAHAQNNARALPTAGQVVAGTAVITQS